jgi:predicted nucleic acid-binding protein
MTKEKVFVDTGAFYALMDRNDPYFVVANKIWSELIKVGSVFYISNYILSETYTLLRYKISYEVAEKYLEVIKECQEKNRIKIKYAQPQVEEEAQKLLLRLKEHDLSYTDAISFAMLKAFDVKKAFSFDAHFQLAGITLLPNWK